MFTVQSLLKQHSMAKEIIITLDVVMAKRKIKLYHLANQIDVHMTNLSILKNGRGRAIKFKTLLALCEVLECTPNDLFKIREKTEAMAGRPFRVATKEKNEDLQTYESNVGELAGGDRCVPEDKFTRRL
jgi:putative transcriptional regulator